MSEPTDEELVGKVEEALLDKRVLEAKRWALSHGVPPESLGLAPPPPGPTDEELVEQVEKKLDDRVAVGRHEFRNGRFVLIEMVMVPKDEIDMTLDDDGRSFVTVG